MSMANPGMRKRDRLKHNKRFDEYKKQRNYVVNLVQKAKNTYFSQLIKDNRDTSSIWKAINSITRKKLQDLRHISK